MKERKIYLASDSRARQKLLSDLGLEFRAVTSAVKEKRINGYLSYAALAKHNALRKAKEVAGKIKSGIVIAADTLVVDGGRIFGKPTNLQAARRMLKRMSKKPQWVYTGIAVIDKDKNKTVLASEKTKVYLDSLSDAEIADYFAQVSPLDKAGSFDIQGKGAFFVRRIEGCFYNVVGLPLRKLYRMLRELGVRILFFLFCFSFALNCIFLAGCSTEYNVVTGEQETFFYSTDREVKLGEAIAAKVETEYKLVDDPLVQKRVQDIGSKIAAVCDRKEIDYYFKVIEEEEVNAFSLPGGFIYVNKGLIEKVGNDDELAAVLAHEVSHIVARDSIKKLQAIMGYSILRILVASTPQVSQAGNAVDVAFSEILSGYSRKDELQSDQLSARYLKLSGYNPRSMIDFLEKLEEINRRKPLKPKSYFKTHPYVPDRIRVVKQELGEKIDFTDYINIEETKE